MQLTHALKARSTDLLNKQNDFYQDLKKQAETSRFTKDEEQDSADFLCFLFQNYIVGVESAFGTVSHQVKNICSCESVDQPFSHGRILPIPYSLK
jgi:hypothetical protein